MTGLDLRPLSLGEILDRTFSLYRRHFLLFFGISAIPQVVVLAISLAQVAVEPLDPFSRFSGTTILFTLATAVVGILAYLYSQGGTVLAVSELYLGRMTSIAESLRRVRENMGALFGAVLLNGLVFVVASIFLIIPGIYMACRLCIFAPTVMIERRGPRESLERSFDLTRANAGRAFLILVLYIVLVFGAALLFGGPFTFAMALASKDPATVRFWAALAQVGESLGGVLVHPVLLIATSIFYYDLRVRKEAFDLQFMMNPDAAGGTGASGVPSILS